MVVQLLDVAVNSVLGLLLVVAPARVVREVVAVVPDRTALWEPVATGVRMLMYRGRGSRGRCSRCPSKGT